MRQYDNQDGTMDMMMGDNTVPPGTAVAFRVDLVGVGAAIAPYTKTLAIKAATINPGL